MKLLNSILLTIAAGCVQAEEDCTSTQMAMNYCAANEFKLADEKLNKLYSEQIKYLQTKETKASFKKAQIAWLQFRDAACAYEAPNDGGSMAGMVLLECKTLHTKSRIQDLERYVACRANGCPI